MYSSSSLSSCKGSVSVAGAADDDDDHEGFRSVMIDAECRRGCGVVLVDYGDSSSFPVHYRA